MIPVATITWARNEAEEALLQASLSQLASLGSPVYITDAGSTPSFIEFLRSGNLFHLEEEPVKGVWPQAKNSLEKAAATGATHILYTEPDKKDFFAEHVTSLLQEHQTGNDTGILMASRSAEAFHTFPSFQQMTETTINNCCAELVGQQVDYTYGPFLIHRNVIPYLDQLPEDIGWGWRPFAFHMAKRLGYAVRSITGDFYCPAGQREDTASERLYRMKQLEQNIRGLVLSASVEL